MSKNVFTVLAYYFNNKNAILHNYDGNDFFQLNCIIMQKEEKRVRRVKQKIIYFKHQFNACYSIITIIRA